MYSHIDPSRKTKLALNRHDLSRLTGGNNPQQKTNISSVYLTGSLSSVQKPTDYPISSVRPTN